MGCCRASIGKPWGRNKAWIYQRSLIYSVNFNEFKKRQKYAIKGLIIELYACKKVDKMTLMNM